MISPITTTLFMDSFLGRGLYFNNKINPHLNVGKVYFDSYEYLKSDGLIDAKFSKLVKQGFAQESDLAERLAMDLLNKNPRDPTNKYKENTIVLYKTFDGFDLNLSCFFEVKSKKVPYSLLANENISDVQALKNIGVNINTVKINGKPSDVYGVPVTEKQMKFLEENQQVYIVQIGWANDPIKGVKFWAYRLYDKNLHSAISRRTRNPQKMSIKKSN